MAQRKPDPPVGVLGPRLAGDLAGAVTHERYLPSPDLGEVIEHHWTVAWDLRGRPPLRRETLPHPSERGSRRRRPGRGGEVPPRRVLRGEEVAAHLADWKRIVGVAPAEYVRRLATSPTLEPR